MEKVINFNNIELGVCYYPEHWDRSLWEDDLFRMEEYGITVIRISEFAWNIFEPSEGEYNFDFFDEYLDIVKRHNIKVIMCTPTATPPAWLTEKYPEVLNADINGNLFHHGMRRQYNYNSPKYKELTSKIVRELAEHYREHECVIGWQIDNELNCEVAEFYSESDHLAFRDFLKDKYKTIDNLNSAWGATFWSQTYTDWSQIYLSRTNACGNSANPHLALDEKRFFSHSAIAYCKLQYDILRSIINKSHFITTNGMFRHLDNHALTDKALDFFSYDCYPNFGYALDNWDDKLRDREWSYDLSKVRSVSSNFGIMEQQAGANGWVNRLLAASPRPGQMRLWTFQAIGHGADFVSYFRWRTCSFGTEIYWHGINDYSNIPNRRCGELKQISKDIKKLTGVAKSRYVSKIALVRDYDNEWDGELDRWHGPLRKQSEKAWFAACTYSHTPLDMLQINDDTDENELLKYSMLVYPHATILTERIAEKLERYVAQGGILVMGARTGYKDKSGRCPMHAMPGYAVNFCGATVKDFTILTEGHEVPRVNMFGNIYESVFFHDILMPMSEDTRIVATYDGGYYSGDVAATEYSFKKGKTFYFGGVFTQENAKGILEHYDMASPYIDVFELAPECEIAVRASNDKNYFFILNYSNKKKLININKELKDLLSNEVLYGNVTIEPYGAMIFEDCKV